MTEGSFNTFDGTELFYRAELNPDAPKTAIVLHGLGEHTGRFDEVFRLLESRGFSYAAFDYRGHGRSKGPEVYADNFDVLVKDAASFAGFLESVYARKPPYVILGNSLGGLLAFSYGLAHPQSVLSMVLFSPCFGLNLPYFLKPLHQWFFKMNARFCYVNPIHPPFLTHDKSEMEKYKSDPLIKRKITSGLLAAMENQIEKIQKTESLPVPFSVSILASGDDRVVDLCSTRAVFDKILSPSKNMKVFDSMFHEIFHETDRHLALEALDACLRAC